MENKIQNVVEDYTTSNTPTPTNAYFFPLHLLYCLSTLIISYFHPLPALQTNVNFLSAPWSHADDKNTVNSLRETLNTSQPSRGTKI